VQKTIKAKLLLSPTWSIPLVRRLQSFCATRSNAESMMERLLMMFGKTQMACLFLQIASARILPVKIIIIIKRTVRAWESM